MVEIKKLPKSEAEVCVSIPWEEWKGHIDAAVQALAGEIKVEGFRPGKAPRSVVEQKVGNGAILNESADRAIRKSWKKTLEEEKIEAIGAPKAEIKKIAEGETLEYTITTAVMPKATLKKNWREGVQKVNAKQGKDENSVEEKDIDKEIEKVANSRAKIVTVQREAKKGDSVRVDFSVLQGGVPIENGSSKDHAIILGSGVFIPGFEEQVEGMKAGDEKEFTLPFPKEYHEKSLAGKDATFKVTLRVVQERDIPKVDDTFAQSLGEFESLDTFRKSIREGMQKERREKKKDEQRTALMDALVEATEMDIPGILVDQEVDQMLANFEGQIQMMGTDMDTYLKQIKKTREDMKREWREQAEKRAVANFSFQEVAKEQEIKPDAKDVEEEMNKTLVRYRSMKDMEKKIDMQRLYAYAQETLTRERVFEYLEKL